MTGVEALFLAHIAWIVAHSDYEYNGEPLPGVHYYSPEMLREIVYGDRAADHAGQTIYGVYDHTSDDMLFPEGFDLTAPENQPTIVHELVYYLQDVRGDHATTDCLPKLELPAYRLHLAWAEEHGIPSDGSGMFDAVVGVMSCQGEQPHPESVR